jgi:hypothetical protein
LGLLRVSRGLERILSRFVCLAEFSRELNYSFHAIRVLRVNAQIGLQECQTIRLGKESHYHAAGARQCADRPEDRLGSEPQSAGERLYRRPCGSGFLRVLRGWVFRSGRGRRRSLHGPPPISTTTIGPVYGKPQNIWYSVEWLYYISHGGRQNEQNDMDHCGDEENP